MPVLQKVGLQGLGLQGLLIEVVGVCSEFVDRFVGSDNFVCCVSG